MADVETTIHSIPSPPLTQSDAIASLLSLSFTASGLAPIYPVDNTSTTESAPLAVIVDPSLGNETALSTSLGSAQLNPSSVPAISALSNGTKHHRRLSSTGKTRRRLSDAREAANRPSPSLLQTTSAALSLASLSLSSSPPSGYPAQVSASFTGASRTLAPAPAKGSNNTITTSVLPLSDGSNMPQAIPIVNHNNTEERESSTLIPISSSNGRSGKKRGMDHKCESCSKIYRHPSCLIKHRWEHTPHWREASKFVLSKHQQVQLLEAAAILSHMSPTISGGKSLPDDRSLWPSFLSGGSLPPPEPPIPTNRLGGGGDTSTPTATSQIASDDDRMTPPSPSYVMHHPVSSSVPISSAFARANSTGPRLHDYRLPNSGTGGMAGVTQLGPGLVGVHTGGGTTTPSRSAIIVGGSTNPSHVTTSTTGSASASIPVPVPVANTNGDDSMFVGYRSDSWALHGSYGHGSSYQSAGAGSFGGHHVASHSHIAQRSVGEHRHHRSSDERHHHSSATDVLGGGGWSLPRSSLRSSSVSGSSKSKSQSRSRSGSASGNSNSKSDDDESESVDIDVDVERERDNGREVEVDVEGMDEDHFTEGYRGRYGYVGGVGSGYGGRSYGGRVPVWKREDDEMSVGFSVREEDEDEIVRGGVTVKGRERVIGASIGMGRKREEELQEWDGMEMEMDMD